jgi:hypothetical protein
LDKRVKIIEDLCEKHWSNYKLDCSGFVKAVASELNILLHGQANDIVEQIQKIPWSIVQDGNEAHIKALQGMFVVGGLRGKPNGHVVIVVPGNLAHGKYPTAYWGSISGVAQKKMTVNWSWNKKDRD